MKLTRCREANHTLLLPPQHHRSLVVDATGTVTYFTDASDVQTMFATIAERRPTHHQRASDAFHVGLNYMEGAEQSVCQSCVDNYQYLKEELHQTTE